MTTVSNNQGFVYRWTNSVNGMMYIGSHNGSNPNYLGSGINFVRAVKKYGIENFTREILYLGDDFRAQEEFWLKLVDAAGSRLYYNMKNEAMGVSLPGVKNPMHKSNGHVDSPETRWRKGSFNRGRSRPEMSERMRGERNPMFGRTDQAHAWAAFGRSTKDKTLVEIYGKERAAEIKKKREINHVNGCEGWLVVTCPHCSTVGRGPNMGRYHFSNCIGPAKIQALVNKIINSKGDLICPYCGMRGGSSGSGSSAMIRWHFDNCKYRDDPIYGIGWQ